MTPIEDCSNHEEGLEQEIFEGGIGIGGSFSMAEWTHYSNSHLYSAFHFATLSAKVEARYKQERSGEEKSSRNEIFGRYFNQHRAYVTAAIIFSCAFLEAVINEIFAGITEHPSGHYSKHFHSTTKLLISKMYSLEVSRTNGGKSDHYNFINSVKTLEKFQVCLSLSEKEPLNRGSFFYQNVHICTQIRNILIHYKPQQTISIASSGVSELTAKHGTLNFAALESSNRFPENVLFEGGNAYFPDRCLGAGCANWAANSSLIFVQEFFSNLGVTPHTDLTAIKDKAVDAARTFQ